MKTALAFNLAENSSDGVGDFEQEGHSAHGVGGTGEAGVVTADGAFHTVESALFDIGAIDVGFGHVQYRLVHGGVVLTRGDQ